MFLALYGGLHRAGVREGHALQLVLADNVRNSGEPYNKVQRCVPSWQFGLLFKRSFTATASRPAYVEDATKYLRKEINRARNSSLCPPDVRFEERPDPTIIEPTDAIIRISAACVCGSDLWPYRGIEPIEGPTPMGHEYCGIVEEVGSEVKNIEPNQFVVGSFWASDNTCPIC